MPGHGRTTKARLKLDGAVNGKRPGGGAGLQEEREDALRVRVVGLVVEAGSLGVVALRRHCIRPRQQLLRTLRLAPWTQAGLTIILRGLSDDAHLTGARIEIVGELEVHGVQLLLQALEAIVAGLQSRLRFRDLPPQLADLAVLGCHGLLHGERDVPAAADAREHRDLREGRPERRLAARGLGFCQNHLLVIVLGFLGILGLDLLHARMAFGQLPGHLFLLELQLH
mmetsp:Transcript_147347/g.257520  ORF Transcript_147347/g.257520 Transcript_147347/m.257520 type:complete len:226 (+) Transcript_147347:466-1143(+)